MKKVLLLLLLLPMFSFSQIEVKVFNNKFGDDVIPVISSGKKKGEWKYSLDTIKFDDFCKTIAEHAFKINKNRIRKNLK